MDRNSAFAAILAGTILLCSSGAAQAHKPLLSVGDNQDGTISIEASFSDGSSAAGHKIILKDEKTGAVISEQRVGEDGTLDLKKPTVPYTVTLDAGEGHKVTKTGPPPSASESDTGSKQSEAEPAAVSPEPGIKAPEPPQSQELEPPTQSTNRLPPYRGSQASASLEISPGAMMAFKMMITAQIVTATALIILLAAIAYFAGYSIGKKSGAAEHK
ncbi:MAG: hypothetical protein AB1733_24555 [Thermodesulfobacteriota bacterium]